MQGIYLTPLKIYVLHSEFISNQECIPVGCVPPTHWAHLLVSAGRAGGSCPGRVGWRVCLGVCMHACLGGACILGGVHAWGAHTPSPWTEWQTCVKTLPFSKLAGGNKYAQFYVLWRDVPGFVVGCCYNFWAFVANFSWGTSRNGLRLFN